MPKKHSKAAVDMTFTDREFEDVFKALRHYASNLRVFLSDADDGDDVDVVRKELARIKMLVSRFLDISEQGPE